MSTSFAQTLNKTNKNGCKRYALQRRQDTWAMDLKLVQCNNSSLNLEVLKHFMMRGTQRKIRSSNDLMSFIL